MADRSSIEWTDATWNPTRGCSRVSEGCRNCYAERIAGRFSGPGQPYEGLVTVRSRHSQTGRATTGCRPKWTGNVRVVVEQLAAPLHWRRPRRVFVNSMSDLFHERLSSEDIAAVFGVMAAAPQHSFQVLTKRPERMRDWFRWICDGRVPRAWCIGSASRAGVEANGAPLETWPLPNVWLGVSVEDQTAADERIPLLLETPAAIRFVSYEPALGPVVFDPTWMGLANDPRLEWAAADPPVPQINWVIAGSESGPGARPAELDWFRSVRDQCASTGVPFFFKQWLGKHAHGRPLHESHPAARGKVSLPILDGCQYTEWPR